jgi:hypothetical protein
MEMGRKKSWDISTEALQLSALTTALEAAHGNITCAARAVGLSRQHATKLVRRYELVAFAAGLRLQCGATRVAGGPRHGTVTGRPRKVG